MWEIGATFSKSSLHISGEKEVEDREFMYL